MAIMFTSSLPAAIKLSFGEAFVDQCKVVWVATSLYSLGLEIAAVWVAHRAVSVRAHCSTRGPTPVLIKCEALQVESLFQLPYVAPVSIECAVSFAVSI